MSLLWSAAVKAFLRIFSGMRSFWAACAVAASTLPYHVAVHASKLGPGSPGPVFHRGRAARQRTDKQGATRITSYLSCCPAGFVR